MDLEKERFSESRTLRKMDLIYIYIIQSICNKMKRASSFAGMASKHVPRASNAELWPHLLPSKEKEENAVVKKVD